MKKLLVTGSEGSLMTETIKKLDMGEWIVMGVDVKPRNKNSSHNYNFVQADLTDARETDTIFRTFRPTHVIQAAAKIYGVGGFNKKCADILGDDISLHRNVLNSSVKNHVSKVVFTSSSMVYERADKHQPVKEDDVYKFGIPLTDYGLSKLTNERLSIAYANQYGIDYTIWRPFNIITPHEEASTSLGDSHVFADFIQSIIINKDSTLQVLGEGDQVRCFTWIDEVANCIAMNIDNHKTNNEIFNVGRNEPITMLHLAIKIKTIAKELGIETSPGPLKFDHLVAYKNDVLYRVPDVSRANSLLQWKANVSVDDSIRRILKTKFQ